MANFTSNFTNLSSCAMFNGDASKCATITIIRRLMNALSIVGCLFVLVIILIFRRYSSFPQRLIIYMSVSAFLASLVDIIQDDKTHLHYQYCVWMGFLSTVTDWWVLMWIWSITVDLFVLVVYNKKTYRWEWLYLTVCTGLPLAVCSLPFIGNHYGPAGAWCWVIDVWGWRFGIWYIPIVVSVLGLFTVYTYISVRLRRQLKTYEGHFDPSTEAKRRVIQEEIRPLHGYPFVYLVLTIFPFIHRMQNIFSNDTSFVLVLLHALTDPLKGACNAVVFALDKNTISQLRPRQFKLALESWWYKKKVLIQEFPDVETSESHECSHDLPPDIGSDAVEPSKDCAAEEGASPVSGEIL